jgi:hypothetical protein
LLENWFVILLCFLPQLLISALQNIKLQDDFGFAPSTLLHHGTGTPAAKAKI